MPNCLAMRTVVVCAQARPDSAASAAAASAHAVQKRDFCPVTECPPLACLSERLAPIMLHRAMASSVARRPTSAAPVAFFWCADFEDFVRRQGFRPEEISYRRRAQAHVPAK